MAEGKNKRFLPMVGSFRDHLKVYSNTIKRYSTELCDDDVNGNHTTL